MTDRPARISPLAITALVLGIIGIVTSVFIIGVLPGILAAVLAFMALSNIRKRPDALGGKGYATVGLACGLLSLPLAVVGGFLVGPAIMNAARDSKANRVQCASNLSLLLKVMNTYGVENDDTLPTAGTAAVSGNAILYTPGTGMNTGQTDLTKALDTIQTYTNGNATASIWIPVLQPDKDIPPQRLLCPSDPYVNHQGSPLKSPAGEFLGSPATPRDLSYSIASPWTVAGGGATPFALQPTGTRSAAAAARVSTTPSYWRYNADYEMALAADMAPLNGTGSPARNVASPNAWNSGNHAGNGQNIAFGDAHVEWTTSPLAGRSKDNIWTINEDAAGNNGTQTPGRVPVAKTTTTRKTDIMMIPMRDLNTGQLH